LSLFSLLQQYYGHRFVATEKNEKLAIIFSEYCKKIALMKDGNKVKSVFKVSKYF